MKNTSFREQSINRDYVIKNMIENYIWKYHTEWDYYILMRFLSLSSGGWSFYWEIQVLYKPCLAFFKGLMLGSVLCLDREVPVSITTICLCNGEHGYWVVIEIIIFVHTGTFLYVPIRTWRLVIWSPVRYLLSPWDWEFMSSEHELL